MAFKSFILIVLVILLAVGSYTLFVSNDDKANIEGKVTEEIDKIQLVYPDVINPDILESSVGVKYDATIIEQFKNKTFVGIFFKLYNISEADNVISDLPEDEYKLIRKSPSQIIGEATETGFDNLINDSRIDVIYYNMPVSGNEDEEENTNINKNENDKDNDVEDSEEKPKPITSTTENIKLASFNAQIFGKSKWEKLGGDFYVDLIEDYSIFILQEIREKDEDSYNSLCSLLQPDYDCIISARAGRTNSKEQIAIFL